MASPTPSGKWLPTYELRVSTKPGAVPHSITQINPTGDAFVTVVPPTTIEFNIDRAYQAQTQKGNFKIKNLPPNIRNLLYKDPQDFTLFRYVQFRAGYPGYMPLIFNGNVMMGSSYRASGETEVTTELDCLDGQYAQVNGWANATFAGGPGAKNYAAILAQLSAQLPFVSGTPIVGDFPTVPVRGVVVNGNLWNKIYQISNAFATIDNGQVKILKYDEVIQGLIPVLDAENGLLGSPTRTDTTIECDFMFEPRLTLGQIVELRSTTNSFFNGPYKVMGFTHRGTISRAVDGERRSTILLWKGPTTFNVVPGIPVTS